ncbi:ABC-F family ATP-binding cassette domain-containing protein [Rossellomorea vietnamensis]|uniref:ABC-F family ATP-binding cassette domain-containing protein n=1 Tax=Rossellomorea vietnamensis TaxID=218284 RepID=UPI00077C4386|nr:ABC-F family ATP-binding cassette domain-containing protein [Rossellomorea vietnamensis]OXS54792.1 multidrug ABC transporter ATP-binding protein [Bacillus sp. DSM 27956]PRX66517.1 ATP-binding cassette subfamily F protein uup [Bacillus sp. V-88]SLK24822.1 ATP-binding cassette, subfamily F, uup [Bacillus sp. V-88]
MRMLTAENLSKTYGEKTLFKEISFSITEKERVGLIGVNGTGKSSLLKLIAGMEDYDTGEISKPNDYHIAYLQQEPAFDGELTVLQQVFSGEAKIIQAMRNYETVLMVMEKNPESPSVQDQLFEAQKQMDLLNAWDASANAKAILTKLGIHDFGKKMNELSGGQKKRVALAGVLIETPDLLILDEPTNHLDYQSIKWLEDYLGKYNGSVLLVTHDRYFLDKVTNRIFELDGGSLYAYKGNYASFIEAKASREEVERQLSEKQQNLYRRELAWMRRGAKARTTKQKARIQRFEHLEDTMSSGPSNGQVDMAIGGNRLGKQVYEFKGASKQFEDKRILNEFSFLIKPKDRIGIVGKNGSGKSTFLNLLAGTDELTKGELIKGQTVKIAYYTQGHEELDENMRMIEYIREAGEYITTDKGEQVSVTSMLERFLFPMSTHGTLIRKLSGGEKRRLFLLKLLMSKPNVLLLDEPTNDLDTETLTVLEDYINEFSGVVITVSHDRYFLDKTADQLLIFNGDGQIDFYYGEYTEYLEKSEAVNKKQPTDSTKESVPVKEVREKEKKRLSYMEKREWDEIEDKMAGIEAKIEEADAELQKVGSNFERAQELMKESEQLNEELERLIERWTYLSEFAE